MKKYRRWNPAKADPTGTMRGDDLEELNRLTMERIHAHALKVNQRLEFNIIRKTALTIAENRRDLRTEILLRLLKSESANTELPKAGLAGAAEGRQS